MNQMQQMIMQAQKMQRELEKAYAELETKEFNVSKNGIVTVTIDGSKKIKSIDIDKDAVDPENKEMIEDAIVLGLNELFEKVDVERNEIEEKITHKKGGLPF